MSGQVEIKTRGGVFAGVLAGLALLLFAGALVATSQAPAGLAKEASARFLQVVTDAVPVVGEATPVSTPAPDSAVYTTLAAEAVTGSVVISVVDSTIFVIGQWVQVGPLTELVEQHHIKAIDPTTHTITFHVGLTNNHAAGERVVLMPESSAKQSENQISSGPSESSKPSASSFVSFDSSASSESGSLEGNMPKTITAETGGSYGGSFLLNLVLGLCYACMYKSKVVEPMGVMRHQPLQHEMHNDFRFGLCDCFKDINICCMVLCCPFVRMAHTNEAADVCGFWESLFCIWCSSLCICGPLCAQVYFRIHIKDHMGIQDHCFNDFCAAFFCLPCVTGQQAMAVDEVLGWKFKCPCNLEHVSSSGGYGQAAY